MRSQTHRRLVQIFTPAARDGATDVAASPAPPPDETRAWWEWAILLLAASAGAGWSVWAGSSERALPFCLGALLGLALAIFARGLGSAAAWLVLGSAGFAGPEAARVPWILGVTLGLVLARRAPVALMLAGAGALAIFWIREAREQVIPWQLLGALLLGGAIVGALLEFAKSDVQTEFWPLGALAIVGGALGAETLAQGAGVASFALGGALLSFLVGLAHASNSADKLPNSADNFPKNSDNLWAITAFITLWRVVEAQVPALRFGADAGELTVLWGALITAAVVHYRTRGLAPLACALAPLVLWFGWGPKVVTGLFLGALLAPLFRARAWPLAAVFVCALVGLAPLIESLPPLARADKLMMGAALVTTWLLLDALIKWLTRERTS